MRGSLIQWLQETNQPSLSGALRKTLDTTLIQSASYPRSASSIDPDLRRDREGVSLFIVDRHAPNVEDAVQQCLILGAASVGLCTPLIGCRSGGLGRP
jgi:hypothetical protein